MWSPDRRRLLALCAGAAAAGALSACGFRPALRDDGVLTQLRGSTRFLVPRGRLGFALRDGLAQRLGRSGDDPAWTLTADLSLEQSGLAITQDSSITRFVVRGESRWRLEGPEGVPPLEGVANSMTAYSATGSLYATRAAQRDAEARVARDLGDRITAAVTADLAARSAG